MFRTIRILAPVAFLAVGLAAPAVAAPDRTTESFQDVVGSCGADDLLVADFTIRQQVSTHGDREQLHLHLTGTVTRTGTGVVGHYAESQLDTFGADGSEVYSGRLSRLVVPGAGVYGAAGHAVFTADGDGRVTPGLSPLMEGDFESDVCELLG